MKRLALCILAAVVVAYLTGAFVQASPNHALWPFNARLLTALFAVGLAVAFFAIVTSEER